MRSLLALAVLAWLLALAPAQGQDSPSEPALETADSASAVVDRVRALYRDDSQAEPAACCKVCNKGKACGDSCINRNYQCHKGPGCACDAY